MSFSISLHADPAPQHFEMIAKVLQAKRNIGDSSTCDVKILLNNGYDMVHSIVVCAHSTVLLDALEPQRAPYQPFNMKDFDSDSVRRVMDWMYSGEIDIPENNIADVLAVVSYLRVSVLQRQIEMKLRNHNGSPILALNIASARASLVMDDTMNRLIHDLTEKLSGLSVEEVSKLTVNSMIAVMAAVLPTSKKVPLINMFVLWIQSKKTEKETINTILQSLAISDITSDDLYALKQYLTNLEITSKIQVSVSPSGTIEIATKKTAKSGEKSASRATSPAAPFHRTQSELTAIAKLPDPFARRSFRTVSEIEDIRVLPDPFEKLVNSSQSNNSILRRETNNGFPNYFTRSEVENLQQMTDPFSESEKETLPRLSMPAQSPPLRSRKRPANISNVEKRKEKMMFLMRKQTHRNLKNQKERDFDTKRWGKKYSRAAMVEIVYFLLDLIREDKEFAIRGQSFWKNFLAQSGRDVEESKNWMRHFVDYELNYLYQLPIDRERILTLYKGLPIFVDPEMQKVLESTLDVTVECLDGFLESWRDKNESRGESTGPDVDVLPSVPLPIVSPDPASIIESRRPNDPDDLDNTLVLFFSENRKEREAEMNLIQRKKEGGKFVAFDLDKGPPIMFSGSTGRRHGEDFEEDWSPLAMFNDSLFQE